MNMAFISQTNFPRLWLLMQNLIGGNAAKQALALEHYHGQKNVLEIGCSVGNISSAFRRFSDLNFTGIDIDRNAIRNAINLAKKRFSDVPNFTFSLTSLEQLSANGKKFEFVLFAGILHHVDDATGLQLLQDALKCLASDGLLIIYEPEAVQESDNWLLRWFCKIFEQGAYLRSKTALRSLVESSGIRVESISDRMISPGIVTHPYVARFNLIVGKPT
ncbi:MAG: class I SAM-dependent methyltransferase [Burkholderiales bacterium]|nr:class I SAM-dependent methyltransferase [Burkholderiales bacterium]